MNRLPGRIRGSGRERVAGAVGAVLSLTFLGTLMALLVVSTAHLPFVNAPPRALAPEVHGERVELPPAEVGDGVPTEPEPPAAEAPSGPGTLALGSGGTLAGPLDGGGPRDEGPGDRTSDDQDSGPGATKPPKQGPPKPPPGDDGGGGDDDGAPGPGGGGGDPGPVGGGGPGGKPPGSGKPPKGMGHGPGGHGHGCGKGGPGGSQRLDGSRGGHPYGGDGPKQKGHHHGSSGHGYGKGPGGRGPS